ncbi:molybdate-binding periplasmic protein precursor [archaeon BMS3Bbin15]|nr:molybdate-binding periplasmic protein precursor [archaeon BMS3Bbin15]
MKTRINTEKAWNSGRIVHRGSYISLIMKALIILTLLTIPLLTSGCTTNNKEDSITVLAAASLTEAFQELSHDFKAKYHIKVEPDFAGSNTLAIDIEHGAYADVYASANEKYMTDLIKRGYVNKSIAFTRNKLVLVVPKTNPANITSVADLRRNVKLVIANRGVPVGIYTRKALLNLDSIYGNGFANQVLSHVVSEGIDVKGVLTKVVMDEADAGFVYSSDALTANGKVKVIELPENGGGVSPKYYIGILTGSKNQKDARKFINFILSPEGRKILKKYGFEAEK